MIPELLGVLELKPKLQFDRVVASPGSGGGSIAHRDVVLILGLTSRSAGKVEPLLSDPRFQRLHIMQSIFSAASRRETLGSHSKGGRRDGALKIDWTKPPPRAWLMGIVCRLDLG